MTTAFETEPCSRCHGTGRHAFNGEHSICYKCEGKNGGRALTKRGRAAKEFYLALRRRPAHEITLGQKVRGPFIKQLTVATIECVPSGARVLIDGVAKPAASLIRFRNKGGLTLEVGETSLVDVLPTEDENEAMLTKALAYQATLTKAGTPRKRT